MGYGGPVCSLRPVVPSGIEPPKLTRSGNNRRRKIEELEVGRSRLRANIIFKRVDSTLGCNGGGGDRHCAANVQMRGPPASPLRFRRCALPPRATTVDLGLDPELALDSSGSVALLAGLRLDSRCSAGSPRGVSGNCRGLRILMRLRGSEAAAYLDQSAGGKARRSRGPRCG
jgi:hypothetical protein